MQDSVKLALKYGKSNTLKPLQHAYEELSLLLLLLQANEIFKKENVHKLHMICDRVLFLFCLLKSFL